MSGNAGLQVQFSEENLALKVASNIRLRHITIEISVSQPKVKILLFLLFWETFIQFNLGVFYQLFLGLKGKLNPKYFLELKN